MTRLCSLGDRDYWNNNVSQQIEQFVRELNDTWQQGKLDELNRFYHPDVVLLPPDAGKPIHGRNTVIDTYHDFASAATLHEFAISSLEVFEFATPTGRGSVRLVRPRSGRRGCPVRVHPLVEQEIDREGCKSIIESAGLPLPPQSACMFCPATKTHELRRHARADLVRIVIMEARAKPRLRKIDGLWRRRRKRDDRPGSMTEYIRREGLLDPGYVDYLIENAPTAIVENQQRFTDGEAIPSWHDFLEAFTPEDDHDGLIPLDILQSA